MKKFITNISLFLLISSIIYLLLLFIWGNIVPQFLRPNLNYYTGSHGHLYSRLKEVKRVENVDILFLGSSHSYRGFDTRIFKKNGYNSFNLGSRAQTPIQTLTLVKRYLERLNPKLIIVEVYPLIFSLDGVESSLDLIANDRNDIYSYEMAIKLNNIKTYNSLLYGTIRDCFSLNDSFIEPVRNGYDTYIPGGFVEKDINYYNPKPFEKEKLELKDDQLTSFKELIEIFRVNNIDLILVYAPITKTRYSSFLNTSYFDSLMSNFAEYYNFNEILPLNDSIHFFDDNHLNQNGVEIFNKMLIEIIENR